MGEGKKVQESFTHTPHVALCVVRMKEWSTAMQGTYYAKRHVPQGRIKGDSLTTHYAAQLRNKEMGAGVSKRKKFGERLKKEVQLKGRDKCLSGDKEAVGGF